MSKADRLELGGTYKVCPACGKVFFVMEYEMWAYNRWITAKNRTRQKVLFCSWKCLRKHDAENPRKGRKEPTLIVRPEKYGG